MSFSKITDILNVHQSRADRPTESSSELKSLFDQDVNTIKTRFNELIDEFTATTASDNIGHSSASITAETVGEALEENRQRTETLLPFPDGSVTNDKLATDVKIGSLVALNTTEKSNVVGAINEVDTRVQEVALTPEDFGATGDGVSDDYAAFLAIKTAYPSDRVTILLTKSYRIGTTIVLPSNIQIIMIGGASVLPDAAVRFNATNISNYVVSTSSAGFDLNEALNDVKIDNVVVDATGYGILLNTSFNGSNVLIRNSLIESDQDAIELNSPSETLDRVIITENVLDATGSGGTTTAGFALGLAAAKDVVFANNIVKHSRNEAIHIEDDQENVIVSNNVINNCEKDATRFLNRANAKPVIFLGNQVKKDPAIGRTVNGIRRINDGNGAMDNLVLLANVVQGFNKGFNLDGGKIANIEGASIEDCNIAISGGGSSYSRGTAMAKDCDLVIEARNNSRFGKVLCDAKPTTLIDNVETSVLVGAVLEGFYYPTGSFATVVGSNSIEVCDLPTRLKGELTVSFGNGTNKIFHTATVTYDGTTFTESAQISRNAGSFNTPVFTTSAGKIIMTFNATGVFTIGPRANFDGTYYLE